ncbi:MAG TPA: beta-ketoacyl synthase N-terminal-like domain-containing protein, partial [Polyangiales bacterium]
MRARTDAVAITGVGILTPLADTLPALGAALRAGRTALCDIDGRALATLADFDPLRYANVRGMRVYPRAAQLQICAATRALADAALDVDPEQLGVISASTYAHLATLMAYDRDLVRLGVERTNPTLMPLALPSSAGALTALALGAKAFAITLSDGGASGLSALALAAQKLRCDRARACVVVASFAHCAELAQAVERAGWLAPSRHVRPFDRDSRGCGLGELAVALTLEPVALAARRGRTPLALLGAHASAFSFESAQAHTTLADVCRQTLAR